MATPQLVSEVMTKDVVSVSEDQTLADLLASMRGMRFRHTPVADDGRLVGLLSERDLLRMSSSSLLPHRDGDEILHRRFHVRDVMTKDVATVSPTTTLMHAGALMLEKRIGCLPVVDEKNVLVGIITTSDFLKVAISLLSGATN
jgi:CBS domain-containing protein